MTSPSIFRGAPAVVLLFIASATLLVLVLRGTAWFDRLFWLYALGIVTATTSLVAWLIARERRWLRWVSHAAQRMATDRSIEVPTDDGQREPWLTLVRQLEKLQTEIAKRQRRLVQNNQQLQAVLASMIEGVLAIDQQDRLVLANQAAGDMLAIDRPDMEGRLLSEVVRIPELLQAAQRARTERSAVETEFETLGTKRRTLRLRAKSLAGEADGVVMIVMYDVTELRQLETMRRDLVANVSHELKTPLASIKAYAETLLMGALEDPSANRRFVQQIEHQAELLLSQILDLLQLARVEAGQAVFEWGQVSLVDTCRQCIEQFEPEADKREISVSLEQPGQPVMAHTDRESVLTILDNLVSNAVRYTRKGGRVVVRVTVRDGKAVIEVADTGIGIAPEHQRRIFERFYRVDRARSRDLGGTGLGLAIVKHTVQALGGTLELDSRLGKGSTFRVLLPLADPHAD